MAIYILVLFKPKPLHLWRLYVQSLKSRSYMILDIYKGEDMESQRHNFQRCDACNTTDGCNGVLPVIDLCAQTVKMNRIATLRSVMEAEGIGCGFDVRGDERLKAYNIG